MPNRQKRESPALKILAEPIRNFLRLESASGILLMLAAAAALAWANSPFQDLYEALLKLPVGLAIGDWSLQKTLHHWVNDGLMVLFFFVVGLEIKREFMTGELSSPRQAALPLFAAVGGMVVPALIFISFNMGTPGEAGWGVPMATDIAFAVGILALLGKRVPFALKIFLLALAIVDDLGAVLVIAIFYTEQISAAALGLAAAAVFFTVLARQAGLRNYSIYVVLGLVAWFGVLKSGVHATVAGVLIGLITPIESLYQPKEWLKRLQETAEKLAGGLRTDGPQRSLSHENVAHLDDLAHLALEAQSPLDRLIHVLHPWVSFVIMPVFALFNAGVVVDFGRIQEILQHPVTLGIVVGLVLGKPIGIVFFSWLAIRLKVAHLPRGVRWRQVFGVGCVAGIGFTMSLFIGGLAYSNQPELEVYTKMAILLASVIAALLGVGTILLSGKPGNEETAKQ